MLCLYRFFTFLLSPLVPLYLKRRAARGKEDSVRMKERLGFPTLARPPGRLLWLHAASLGETASVLPLIEAYLQQHPALHILLTTGTVTSSKLAAARLPVRAMHQFVPVDTPFATARFLAYWKPDAALWVESEFWPNLLLGAHAQEVNMALINARMSEDSLQRWARLPAAITRLLSCFGAIYAGSVEDAARLQTLGARVEYLGNLKFAVPPLPDNAEARQALAQAIGNRPLWLAASTHEGEEASAAEIHQQLRTTCPQLLTIIVPRHPPRGESIAAHLRHLGLQVSRRSDGETITAKTDIYLADTMGELGIFYRLANIVFIGGSLIPRGGQNPLEPARLGCAILCGPHMENFTAIIRELETKGACLRVADAAQLATQVQELMANPASQAALADAALAVMQEKQGIVSALINALAPLLKLQDNTPHA